MVCEHQGLFLTKKQIQGFLPQWYVQEKHCFRVKVFLCLNLSYKESNICLKYSADIHASLCPLLKYLKRK